MRKPNFEKLSSEVLANYKSEIEEILRERKQNEEKKNKILKKVKSLVESEGLSMEEVLSGSAPVKSRKATGAKRVTRKVQPKYANPKDKSQTWTGRGRKPLWVQDHIKKGGTVEDLAI
ncbi:H-NS histone family protein [Granulosicoccaceae sp. 1_MG-2023]|nr:H-NS histone family protein [Granulosicoccaceae sp. 1_MG-2023]